jgi:pimeloyl-ACP methyl ester carboxylesterase
MLEGLRSVACCQIIDHGQANSLVAMAQQLLALAPPRFALAGHSMGGRVALEVMRLAPERVSHLALPKAAGAAGDAEVAKRMALMAIAQRDGVRAMALQWVQGMVAPQRLSDTALVERVVAMMERKSAEVFAHQIKALIERPDGTDVLRQLRVPTLVLCGALDSWSNPAQHEEIAQWIPARPAVVSVADAGHMVTMERPEPVVQAFKDWLSKP